MSTKVTKVDVSSLVSNLGLAASIDNFNVLLNTMPAKSWLKIYNGVQYQPVERVKNNITTIFQDYDWEIQTVQVIANSITITGNLITTNPVTGKVRKLAGIGAWPIQLKKGSSPTDFNMIVQDAIQKNAPAAESLAFKNAAKKLGILFGDGVPDEIEFNGIYSAAYESQKSEEEVDIATLDNDLKVNQAVASGKITKEQGAKIKAALKGELAI